MGARASAHFLPPVPLLRPCSTSSRGLTPLDSAHLQVHVAPHSRAGLRPQSLRTTPRSPASREPPPATYPASLYLVPLTLPKPCCSLLLPPTFTAPIPLPSRRPPTAPPPHPTPPPIRDPSGGRIRASSQHPIPKHLLQAGLSRKLRPRGWRSLAAKATPLLPPPLHRPPARATLSRTCSAAPRAAPAGDYFLIPAPGVSAAPASPACSPRGPGVAAGRPGPQPDLGPGLSHRSWEQAPFSLQGHPRTGYTTQDPRLQLPRLARPSTRLHSWSAAAQPVCASRSVLGEQPGFFLPAVSGGSPSPSQGRGLGNGHQPGPSLTRQPGGPTSSWYPL